MNVLCVREEWRYNAYLWHFAEFLFGAGPVGRDMLTRWYGKPFIDTANRQWFDTPFARGSALLHWKCSIHYTSVLASCFACFWTMNQKYIEFIMSYRILIVQILHTQESSDFRIISILLIFQSWESEQQSSANKVWIWICLACCWHKAASSSTNRQE